MRNVFAAVRVDSEQALIAFHVDAMEFAMRDIKKEKPEPRTETEKVNREEDKLPNHGVSPDYTDADREGESKHDERD